MNNHLTQRLLLISNDLAVASRLKAFLPEYADTTFVVSTEAEAFSRLKTESWDLVMFYTGQSVASGLNLMVKMQAEDILTCVVLVAENPRVEDAVLAMRSGCSSFLGMDQVDAGFRSAAIQGLQRTVLIRASAEQRSRDRSALRMAQSRVVAMEGQIDELQQSITHALMSALEVREPHARIHSLRLSVYARHLAKAMDYPASLMPHLMNACMFHDIGKLELPIESLNNPGILPASQLDRLKPHTWLGEKILNGINFLRPAARIVRHHHERWDGSGYPDHLAGENIPLGSRILSVVDALDAITNEQTYRPAQNFADAVREISKWTRRQFDPVLIEKFREIPVAEWAALREEVERSEGKGEAPPKIVALGPVAVKAPAA